MSRFKRRFTRGSSKSQEDSAEDDTVTSRIERRSLRRGARDGHRSGQSERASSSSFSSLSNRTRALWDKTKRALARSGRAHGEVSPGDGLNAPENSGRYNRYEDTQGSGDGGRVTDVARPGGANQPRLVRSPPSRSLRDPQPQESAYGMRAERRPRSLYEAELSSPSDDQQEQYPEQPATENAYSRPSVFSSHRSPSWPMNSPENHNPHASESLSRSPPRYASEEYSDNESMLANSYPAYNEPAHFDIRSQHPVSSTTVPHQNIDYRQHQHVDISVQSTATCNVASESNPTSQSSGPVHVPQSAPDDGLPPPYSYGQADKLSSSPTSTSVDTKTGASPLSYPPAPPVPSVIGSQAPAESTGQTQTESGWSADGRTDLVTGLNPETTATLIDFLGGRLSARENAIRKDVRTALESVNASQEVVQQFSAMSLQEIEQFMAAFSPVAVMACQAVMSSTPSEPLTHSIAPTTTMSTFPIVT